ncbi:hypothetical protein ABT369_44325 [Dactylosporangium sp. NPDC000244]|uniref:hypothetical protein n=1 Tax=Dactylosporangium sp. NPDC000244 TaxID=3154365 RepID=UPI00331F4374
MPEEPWESYHRNVLRSGLSYPVGRSIVEASLRAAGVHLLALDFTLYGDSQSDIVLLQAVRYSDIGSTYDLARGTPNRPRCVLKLYAVPSAIRAEAGAALTTGGGLLRACAWLAAADHANPTWLDKSHTWTAYLHSGALRVEEREY